MAALSNDKGVASPDAEAQLPIKWSGDRLMVELERGEEGDRGEILDLKRGHAMLGL